MIIEKVCMDCKNLVKIEVEEKAYEKWKDGTRIQQAMPMLSADEREILISGVCGPCFDKMFPE